MLRVKVLTIVSGLVGNGSDICSTRGNYLSDSRKPEFDQSHVSLDKRDFDGHYLI